jgi:hypothetical protein
MSSEIYKLYIPQIIVLLLGIIIISEYFLAIPTLGIISSWARELGILVFSAAMVVAVVGVAIRSIREIKRRTRGEWYFHIWLLIFLFSWIITGCVLTSAHTFYKWLFENFITALYQAMLGLCVFSLFTLFYRFKPRLPTRVHPLIIYGRDNDDMWGSHRGGNLSRGNGPEKMDYRDSGDGRGKGTYDSYGSRGRRLMPQNNTWPRAQLARDSRDSHPYI